jgi:hypothetical protein
MGLRGWVVLGLCWGALPAFAESEPDGGVSNESANETWPDGGTGSEGKEHFLDRLHNALHSGSIELETPKGAPRMLDWDRPVECTHISTHEGTPAHVIRFQCDNKERVCLVAPNVELDAQGKDSQIELSRVQPCVADDNLMRHAMEGYQMLAASPETPPGWVRDERARIMQFNFDMHRRIWIGGGYSPSWVPGSGPGTGFVNDGEAEFGTRIDWMNDDNDTLTRLHILEGRLDPVRGQVDVTALQWDISHTFPTPALRITTFFGEPRRFDLSPNVGYWVMAGRVESEAKSTPQQIYVTIAAIDATVDLWRSDDLDSYLRIRVGPDFGFDSVTKRYFLAPNIGVDFEDILDVDGFNRLFANATYEYLLPLNGAAGPLEGATQPTHFNVRAGYELIALAVNDQPLSLVAELRGRYRDDLVATTEPWEYSGLVGIRFSFWAPARRNAKNRAPVGDMTRFSR